MYTHQAITGKNIFATALLIALLALAAGCAKTNTTVFSWSYQGLNYVADSAYSVGTASVPNCDIDAFKSPLIFALSGTTQLTTGSYTIANVNNSGKPSAVLFPQGLVSASGTLNVTSNNGKEMSGNFSVTYTDGSVMTGNFVDIPIR
jgi:hypothetical protein